MAKPLSALLVIATVAAGLTFRQHNVAAQVRLDASRTVSLRWSTPEALIREVEKLRLDPLPAIRVSGHVRDESGAPVQGAQVEFLLMPGDRKLSAVTDGGGAFSLDVPPTARLSITASHPDFGTQWTSGVVVVGLPEWTGFAYRGEVPAQPVELVLRKGMILRGRARDTKGEPFARQEIFLVSSYIGSGPSRFAATTDASGHFSFARSVLNRWFELVPRALDQWHPSKPGHYVRIAQSPDEWLSAAQSGTPVEIQIEGYTLVPVTLEISALRSRTVQVWTRRAKTFEWGTTLEADQTGRVQIAMEEGALYELWVFPAVDGRLGSPARAGRRTDWIGTPTGPTEITIKPPMG